MLGTGPFKPLWLPFLLGFFSNLCTMWCSMLSKLANTPDITSCLLLHWTIHWLKVNTWQILAQAHSERLVRHSLFTSLGSRRLLVCLGRFSAAMLMKPGVKYLTIKVQDNCSVKVELDDTVDTLERFPRWPNHLTPFDSSGTKLCSAGSWLQWLQKNR